MPEGLLRTAEGFRGAYAECLHAVERVTDALDETAWDILTGCPGWSVRDVVAHIAALESVLIGRDLPQHTIPEGLAHVRNQPGEYMEVGVDHRRSWSLDEVRADFREVIGIRLDRLATFGEADLDGDAIGFFGPVKARNQMTIRVFDLWSHEQDIRRAVGRPGGFDGLAAAHSREMLARGVGTRAAQRLAPEDGTAVLLDITGPGGARRGITFRDGRSRTEDEVPASPTAALHLDLNTLAILGCGRADDPGARDRVHIDGDVDLGRRILEDVAITP